MQTSANGEPLNKRYGILNPPTLVASVTRGQFTTFSRLRVEAPGLVLGNIAPEGAYSFMLWMTGQTSGDVCLPGGTHEKVVAAAGSVCPFDLSSPPSITFDTPLDGIRSHLPLAAIQEFSEESGGPREVFLRPPPCGTVDPIIQHLIASLDPVFRHPDEHTSLFVDHIALAFQTHLLCTYSTSTLQSQPIRRGLAPWQERRAKELMNDNLGNDISVAQLAIECGVSSSHFARAFKQTTGRPPHRWLLERRVETAQDLLLRSDMSLKEIAAICHFTDQNHLIRVFSRVVGTSPGAWRRARRG
jgi:AraC family transcriptional regulator